MKKLLSFCLIMTVIFLTGCESNRLVCTYTDNEIKDLKSKTKYVFTFDETDIKSATMTTEVTLSGQYNNDTFIENYKNMAIQSGDTFNETEGISAVVTNKKNVITLKVELDPSKMNVEDIELYGLDLSKEDLKVELEESGYTCK